jgi:hypothetical protein
LRGEARVHQIYATPKKGQKVARKVIATMEDVEEVVGPSSPLKRNRRRPAYLDNFMLD